MKSKLFLMLLAVVMAVIAGSVSAATMFASLTAPVVDGADIANYGTVTGTDKWWTDNGSKGQTFTTGNAAVLLNSITYLISDTQKAEPVKTYAVRVGTVNVSEGTFSEIRNETATQDFTWNSSEYMTWTFDTPVLLAPNTEYGVDVGMTSSSSGWTTGIPYLQITGDEYAGGTRYASGVAPGLGDATLSGNSGDRIFHLDMEDPLKPSPTDGSIVPAGDVDLSWTNLDPNTAAGATETYVDVFFGTDPCALTQVLSDAAGITTVQVSAPVADTYYWQIHSDTGEPNVIVSPLFVFYVIDTDGDGLPDEYELAYTDPCSPTSMDPAVDEEPDGLTNMEEFLLGTNPIVFDTDGDTLGDGEELAGVGLRSATDPLLADTDADGIDDGAESNTGIYVDASDTGTNPTNPDTDGDGLIDGVETNTGIFVDAADAGTDPLGADSDNDGAEDWYEVAASYTDPTDPVDMPVIPYPLPKADDTPAATDKPVKVYIMAGQSNMVGFGRINGDGPGYLSYMVNTENKFPNLVDETGSWISRNDVMYRGVISCIGDDYLRPGFGADGTVIGPEFGFGQVMGYYHDEPVLLIKSSIGNRSISWDYAPPSTQRFEYDGSVYAAYGESPNSWLVGEGPTPYVWYCGKQWDDCFLDESEMGAPAWADATAYPDNCQVTNNGVIYMSTTGHTSSADTEPGVGAQWSTCWEVYSVDGGNVVDVLDNFATEYPQYAAQGFEIAGYVWWQGHKDQDPVIMSERYELNMVNFINDIRDYYEIRYPANTIVDAPFVLATVAFDGGWDNTSEAFLNIAEAQLAVTDPNDAYGFKGNVKTVEARGYWRDSSISPTTTGYHYNHNAETYMLTGDALGRAMIELQGAFAVDAGDDMVTWSGETVALDAAVQAGVSVSSYTWSAVSSDPANTTIEFSATNVEDPTITISKTTTEAVTVTLTLTVDDGENNPVSDTMEIEVYDDACQAARVGKGLAEAYPADIAGDDCVVDINDLAEMALKWLEVKGLAAPQHK